MAPVAVSLWRMRGALVYRQQFCVMATTPSPIFGAGLLETRHEAKQVIW